MPPKAPIAPATAPATLGRGGKAEKGKEKGQERIRSKGRSKARPKRLKGWLKTPADWARFDAWATVNALPRRIAEPEPIVRRSWPLWRLRKRILFLTRHPPRTDPSEHCRPSGLISSAALKAMPSIRTQRLAWPVIRMMDYGREFPAKISRAVLAYQASQRILEISQPKIYVREECKPFLEDASKRKTTGRERRLALTKKILDCPEELTPEEEEELFTPRGIRRSALTYKFKPWMFVLALPSYKNLKERDDAEAKAWMKIIVEQSEVRGRKALARQRKKEKKERKRRMEEKKVEAEKLEDVPEEMRDEAELEEVEEAADVEETPDVEEAQDIEEEATEKEPEAEEAVKVDPETGEPIETDEEEVLEEPAEVTGEVAAEEPEEVPEKPRREKPRVRQKARVQEEPGEEERKKMEKLEKKRKAEKHAWRYQPPPCKDDPFIIKRAALRGKVSPHMDKLAEPIIRESKVCKDKPFEVKKSALSASASGRVAELAKPMRPRSPVERQAAREKDEFGRPIFEKPAYGKVLPKTKPYKMGECKTEEEKAKEKKKGKKIRPIDPIVYECTIDPCFDARRAKKQYKERKRAEQIFMKENQREKERRTRKEDKVDEKDDEEPKNKMEPKPTAEPATDPEPEARVEEEAEPEEEE